MDAGKKDTGVEGCRKERYRSGGMKERKIQEWRDAERGKAEKEE